MRHRVADKKFNRDSNARKGLFLGLLRNLTEHGEITTTLARAKVIKGLADKAVHQAQDSSLASRRLLHRMFGKREIVSTLVERVAPAMADRTSGFTRVISVGRRRGDNTSMAKIEFVNKPERLSTLKNLRTEEKKVAPVAKEKKEVVKAEKAELPEKTTEKKAKVAVKKVKAATK